MKIFDKIINIYRKINLIFLKFKYRKYLITSHKTRGVTNIVGHDFSMRFDSAFKNKKNELDKKVELLIKKAKNNPYKLLKYIENHSTKVYKIKNADKILSVINETEGFITPKKGFKAIYLNLIICKKLSTFFEECFILRNSIIEPYCMIQQFYSWYAFKSGLAGYEYESQEKFKKLINTKNYRTIIDTLGISDILEVKEALRRDIEALDFVINIAKNTEGSKQAFNKILNGTSAVKV